MFKRLTRKKDPSTDTDSNAPTTQPSAEDFAWVGPDIHKSMESVRPSISYWRDAWRRLKQNRIAIIALVILIILTVCSFILPELGSTTFDEQHWDDIGSPRHRFQYMQVCQEEGEAGPMPFEEAQKLSFWGKIKAWREGQIRIHIFGVDDSGADFWIRLWYGGRVSLSIGLIAALCYFLIGVPYGAISGLVGKRTDTIMMRIVEIIYGIPYLIIVILLMTVMKAGMLTIVVAMAAVGWTGLARLVRGQVVQLKEQEYVIAARTMGASSGRIIRRHVLPNTLSVVIVNLTLAIPGAIFTESFLSYIGIGISPPQCSWGSLCEAGRSSLFTNPQFLFYPAGLICLTMLSFNLLGDALRNVLDPRMRK